MKVVIIGPPDDKEAISLELLKIAIKRLKGDGVRARTFFETVGYEPPASLHSRLMEVDRFEIEQKRDFHKENQKTTRNFIESKYGVKRRGKRK